MALSDVYSPRFRSTLVHWLRSIPAFPKPFDFVFEPLSTVMYSLLNDLAGGECYQTCLVEKKENCIKYRTLTVKVTAPFKNHYLLTFRLSAWTRA